MNNTDDEIRQMANSHDGVPNDVFDRWLAEHDKDVAAKARAEVIQRLRDTAQPERTDSTHNAVADWLEREEFDQP